MQKYGLRKRFSCDRIEKLFGQITKYSETSIKQPPSG